MTPADLLATAHRQLLEDVTLFEFRRRMRLYLEIINLITKVS